DRLGLDKLADLRFNREIFRLSRGITCDGLKANQQQKDATGNPESVEGDAKKIKQRGTREKEKQHQSQHSERDEEGYPALHPDPFAGGVSNKNGKHPKRIEKREESGGKGAQNACFVRRHHLMIKISDCIVT